MEFHRAWCRNEGRSNWEERRAAARLRLFLDLAAEERRKQVMEQISDDVLNGIRDGRCDPYEVLECLT